MADPRAGEADRIRSYFGTASWRRSAGRDLLVAERREVLENLVRRTLPPTTELSVCDVGCGGGSDLERWRSLGVPEERLFGTELVEESSRAARQSVPRATIVQVEAFEIPFPDRSFDLVTASLVVSSIRDPAGRRELLAEMRRVTRDDGLLAVYDFRVRKPWNRNVVPIGARELAATLGEPTGEYRLAPFLPLLDLALRLPAIPRAALVALLPRTHRLWIWHRKPAA